MKSAITAICIVFLTASVFLSFFLSFHFLTCASFLPFVLLKRPWTYVIEHLCDENRQQREGMRKCLMINKLQKIFHMHLNYTYSPRSKFPWLVWGSICNAKKAVLRPMWNIKMKSFSLKCDITEPRPGSAKFLSKVINFYVWWEDSWKSIGM